MNRGGRGGLGIQGIDSFHSVHAVHPFSLQEIRIIKLLCYLWAIPNTLLGVPFVLLAILTGGRLGVVAGVLELHSGLIALILRYCVPIRGGAGALTLGHIVLGLDERTLSATRQHERAHVRQCELWGPVFIPAYLGAWLWAFARGKGGYEGNYFEREAIEREAEVWSPNWKEKCGF